MFQVDDANTAIDRVGDKRELVIRGDGNIAGIPTNTNLSNQVFKIMTVGGSDLKYGHTVFLTIDDNQSSVI